MGEGGQKAVFLGDTSKYQKEFRRAIGKFSWGTCGRFIHSLIDSSFVDSLLSKLQERGKGREAWSAAVHWFAKSRTQLSD